MLIIIRSIKVVFIILLCYNFFDKAEEASMFYTKIVAKAVFTMWFSFHLLDNLLLQCILSVVLIGLMLAESTFVVVSPYAYC